LFLAYNLPDLLQGFDTDSRDDRGIAERCSPKWRGGGNDRTTGMTKIDSLIDVASRLREARALAERCSDPALLYFIDMTIAHACAVIEDRFERKSARARKTGPVKAAA
jgi:hypothetical protein